MSSTCRNCDAKLSAAEIRDGWCETCGKRLPGSSGGRASRSASLARSGMAGPAKPTAGGIAIVVVCVSIGALIANFVVRNNSLATGLGCGIGGALGAVLARRAGMWPKPV